ncbi:unnamed protein product [Schistocephalus solidus]|uniref:Tetratricopeptide repeat protein 39B n=1 Tax=Schistocephalus solidus TaxID=70667 RepID=A0A183SJI6_SCHSO|nr:unnamed protein product [Schistocephalus solidus]
MDGIHAAEHVLTLFLDNKFQEAKETAKSMIDQSIYHAVSYGTMLHLQAAATLEAADLKMATDYIRYAVKLCNKYRRRVTVTETFSKATSKQKAAFYAAYTEDQAHAELCYSESLLQLVFLMVLQDEKLSTLIRSSIKLRECYRCYRTCWKIHTNKDWGNSPSRAAFDCGVHMGVGAFNLLLSLLPSRVLSLLEIVGFSGNRDVGLKLLREGAKIRDGVRDPLCTLIILVYDLYATQMIGIQPERQLHISKDDAWHPMLADAVGGEEASALTEARLMLDNWSSAASGSAIFLFLAGRLELLSANFDPAEELFFQSIRTQSGFANYHHICYWELMWCYCVQGKWLQAMKYAERLACESKWSQATYRYLKAALIIQFMEEEAKAGCDISGDRFASLKDRRLTPVSLSGYVINKEEPKERDVSEDADGGTMALHVEKLLEGVPQMVQRIAGKSLPIEKFAMRKAKRFFEQGKRLTLPGLELMYLWNGFKLVYSKAEILEKFLLLVEFKLTRLLEEEVNYKYFADDFCLATMLKGVCLRCLGRQMQAKMCFMEVVMNAKKIQVDTYLLPFSEVELCQISLDEGDFVEAKKHLDAACSTLKVKKNDNAQDANVVQPSPITSWHEGLADAGADDDENPFDADYDPTADDGEEIITFKTTGYVGTLSK